MNKFTTLILMLLLFSACSINYPVLEPEAKVFKKNGNEVLFIFSEHEGKRTGYQWFRVENPEEYQIDSVYFLTPKVTRRNLDLK